MRVPSVQISRPLKSLKPDQVLGDHTLDILGAEDTLSLLLGVLGVGVGVGSEAGVMSAQLLLVEEY